MFPFFLERRTEKIDDTFYSRQRYLIGADAMLRLSDSCILIIGLSGVGIEIAKNLVLAGVKKLFLDDCSVCCADDLVTQFFIRQEDIQQKLTRAEASLKPLSALNPLVLVKLNPHPLTRPNTEVAKHLINFPIPEIQCMVVTNYHMFFAALLNNYCRRNHIRFVYVNTLGIFGNVFCDFGLEFVFGPPDEEPTSTFFIKSVEKAERPRLVFKETSQHKIFHGSLITFREVTGMVELNEKIVEVKKISSNIIELNIDTRNFGEFTGNGLAIEVKQSLKVSHLPLAEQIESPKFCIADFNYADQMNLAFLTLSIFIFSKKRLPKPWSDKEANLFLKIAKRLCPPDTEMMPEFLKKICYTLRGQLPPLCSFLGGVAAQEVIKAVTHQFTPLDQWMYFNVECMVPSESPITSNLLKHPRYGPLVLCIGPTNMEKLVKASAFMVGCGSVGSEILKNFALLGLASGSLDADFRVEASSSDEDSDEELIPLMLHDVHEIALAMSHLGMELNAPRLTEVAQDTQPIELPEIDMHELISTIPTDIWMGAERQDETDIEFSGGDDFTPSASSVNSSAASYYQFGEEEMLMLPVMPEESSDDGCNADLESMDQESLPCPQPPAVSNIVDACTSPNNSDGPCITIADINCIKMSDLNRQLLFRLEHIGQAKSTAVAAAIRQINPALRVMVLENESGCNIKREFTSDGYLQSLGSRKVKPSPPIVLSALDNTRARLHLGSLCLVNRLAMFDSYTWGTKGCTQVVIPWITRSYSSQMEEGNQDTLPYCTLKSFPAEASDCVEWAKDKFYTQFTGKPQSLDQLLSAFPPSPMEGLANALHFMLTQGPLHQSPNYTSMQSSLLGSLTASQVSFLVHRPCTWKQCIHMGRQKFEKYFNHKALNLLYQFPDDKLLDGELFWQLPRRKPRPIAFDPSNNLHIAFVWSFARLLGKQADIRFPRLHPAAMASYIIKKALNDYSLEPYVPLKKEVIVDPSASRPTPPPVDSSCLIANEEFQTLLKNAIERLRNLDYSLVCHPIEMDMDNETDGHLDFIVAAANLRAEMYGLSQTERYEIKRIAGHLAPSIATTTAIVAALTSLEVVKYICFSNAFDPSECFINHLRNNLINLSHPSVISDSPESCISKMLPNGMTFTLWDRWEIDPSRTASTLKELIDTIKSIYGLQVATIRQNCRDIYISRCSRFQADLHKPLFSLLEVTLNDDFVDLAVTYEGRNDDVKGPPLRLMLPS